MDVTDIRVLSAVGLLVVGVVTVAGAMAVSLLAPWLIETGLAVAGWFESLRARGGGAPRPAQSDPARGASASPALRVGPEHALLVGQAQQASGRLRC